MNGKVVSLLLAAMLAAQAIAAVITQRYSALKLPIDITVMKPQPDWYRWWVVARAGKVLTFPHSATSQSEVKTVLDISSRCFKSTSYNEFGLINLLFSPHWTTDRYFFVYYQDERSGYQNDPTKLTTGRLNPTLSGLDDPKTCWSTRGNRDTPQATIAWPVTAMVSRFKYHEGDPTATLNSEKVIMSWGLGQTFHSGGGMVFIGDNLHIATGDNGDPWQAQSLNTVKGKVLRINPFVPSGTKAYSVPSTNPFIGKAPAGKIWLPEIYAYGLRNPWRCFANANSEILCGVVGQDNVESIVKVSSAANFGHPDYEGSYACINGGSMGYKYARGNADCPPTQLNIGCGTQPTPYALTKALFTYCHVSTDPTLPPYKGSCSTLLSGAVVIFSGFYNGAGGSSSLQKGDAIFVDPTGGSPQFGRLRKDASGKWNTAMWFTPSSGGPSYVIMTGFDWDGEIYMLNLRTSLIYTINMFTYKSYPNTAVSSTPTPSSTCPNGPQKQCAGGASFTGKPCCQAGYVCTYVNKDWSDCKLPTTSPVPAPVPAPARPYVALTNVCLTSYTPFTYPEVAWTRNSADGSYSATLTLNAIRYQNIHGETTTRGYFQGATPMLPGPIMRLKPGATYYLTVKNSLSTAWPNPANAINEYRKPCSTNMHVHGLHISPTSPADDMGTEIAPGQSFKYKYVLPADHAGGTHLYHAHFHGSSAVQAAAGAVGMIIVEDNRYIEKNNMGWPTMPEAKLVMQRMSPVNTASFAKKGGDSLYRSTATADHYLLNGCDASSFRMTIAKGQWTRLRMLHIGTIQGSVVVTLKPVTAGVTGCKAALLAKDGVYLSSIPRYLTEAKFLFSIASRADVAIRCSSAGTYSFSIAPVNSPTTPLFTTKITVSGTGATAVDLALWSPLRPYYLKSLTSYATPADAYDISMSSGAINGYLFTGPAGTPMRTINEGSMQHWTLIFSGVHPFHMHVNHVQLTTIAGNYASAPSGWHKVGDWLDVVDFPAETTIRFRADRYGGKVHLHCHIFEHSDIGMVAILQINNGQGPNGTGGGSQVPHWPAGLPLAKCGNGILELGEWTDAC